MRWTLALALFCLATPLVSGQKLQVYILAGQSNMQGHAKVETFDYIGDDPKTAPLLRKMRHPNGKVRILKRVRISYLTSDGGGRNGAGEGWLTAGYGARRRAAEDGGKIGPELTFGITIAEASSGPILIIKTAWGGKSLHTDFRSPSAGPYVFSKAQTQEFEKRKQDPAQVMREKAAATGRYYRFMIDHVKHVLANLESTYPGWQPRHGYELRGFIWFQGWNDMVDRGTYPNRNHPSGYAAYSDCLAHFIRDVRQDLDAPRLPFVIGVMGVGGPIQASEAKKRTVHRNFREAMAAPAALPEFAGRVVAVQTAPFWDARLDAIDSKLQEVREMRHRLRTKHKDYANADGRMNAKEQSAYIKRFRAKLLGDDERIWARGASNAAYHYLGCAKTMALIGEAFARATIAIGK